jgi:hypothetical protein
VFTAALSSQANLDEAARVFKDMFVTELALPPWYLVPLLTDAVPLLEHQELHLDREAVRVGVLAVVSTSRPCATCRSCDPRLSLPLASDARQTETALRWLSTHCLMDPLTNAEPAIPLVRTALHRNLLRTYI